MIEKMADFLSVCPQLSDRQIYANFLAEDEGSVSLAVSDGSLDVKEYADGAKLKAASFTLGIRGNFAVSDAENRSLDRQCRRIEKWIEEQNLKGNLPELDEGFHAVSIGVGKCFTISKTTDFSARYEAQIELVYYAAAAN